MKYYVYIYYDLITQEPFYIGKGCDDRYKLIHHQDRDNSFIHNKIKKLGKENIRIQFLYRSDDEQKCLDKEIYWINKIGRRKLGAGPLCNLTAGGESNSGPNNGMYGKKHTKETREKMSKNNGKYWKGKNLSKETKIKISETLTGMKHSEETKQKMSKSTSGENNPMYGIQLCGEKNGMFDKKHSLETRRKISETKKARSKDANK